MYKRQIDDNADIRHYVKSLLVKEFRVLDAADGATGIRLAMKYVPDAVSYTHLGRQEVAPQGRQSGSTVYGSHGKRW